MLAPRGTPPLLPTRRGVLLRRRGAVVERQTTSLPKYPKPSPPTTRLAPAQVIGYYPGGMYPVLFRIGPLTIYSFGTMLALAFLAAGYVAGRELERRREDPEAASYLVFWAAVGGLVGARLWIVADDWGSFVSNPLSFLLTTGGFVWYGGLLGGTLAVSWVLRRKRIPWLLAADAVAPALALGYAIGRIGCHLAGDGDWGVVTTLPWGVAYTHAIVGWPHPPGVRVHPTPLYETAVHLLIFVWLLRLARREEARGAVFAAYLMTAGSARLLVEFIRVNPAVLWGLTEAQLTSIAVVVAGATLWLAVKRKARVMLPAPGPAARS